MNINDNKSKDFDILGQYYREISQYEAPTDEENRDLIIRAQNGDENARTEFVERNLKLVARIARFHAYKGVPILDIIQYGNEALLRSINNYNPECEEKVCSYVGKCVDLAIRRKMSKDLKPVNYSYTDYYTVGKIKNYCHNYFLEYGNEPSNQTIMDELNVKQYQIDLYKNVADGNLTVSFDTKMVNPNGGTTKVVDVIGNVDDNYNSVDDKVTMEQIINYILKMNLPPKGKFILLYRYGFIDGKFHNLEEIAKIYNLSHERIRQIEIASLNKIKRSRNLKKSLNSML